VSLVIKKVGRQTQNHHASSRGHVRRTSWCGLPQKDAYAERGQVEDGKKLGPRLGIGGAVVGFAAGFGCE